MHDRCPAIQVDAQTGSVRGVLVRTGELADRSQVQAIASQGMREFGLTPDFNGLDRELGNFGASGGPVFAELVAEHGGEVVGCLILGRKGPELLKLTGFYVDPKGRGQGVGKTLLRAAIECACKNSYQGIYLETWGKMVQAVHLYESFGWKATGALPPESGA